MGVPWLELPVISLPISIHSVGVWIRTPTARECCLAHRCMVKGLCVPLGLMTTLISICFINSFGITGLVPKGNEYPRWVPNVGTPSESVEHHLWYTQDLQDETFLGQEFVCACVRVLRITSIRVQYIVLPPVLKRTGSALWGSSDMGKWSKWDCIWQSCRNQFNTFP